ncbi:hypothetical protein [Blastococcus sp. TF02A-26]|uniref:restriction endonuclease subunit S n=1 Tax=Blastococcus sp. TF02A-26 TaxID=2250577 RepID=UPI000DE9EB10|nr:hypothetical protein [Blastococcus sp. TF02A-26]RBY78850.1 hypothetical protein DQ240_22910 [Blastococcus sp. TF02A-26]
MTLRIRHLAQINPSSLRFDALPPSCELTFMPLETVWADERVDASRVAVKADVSSGYVRFQNGDVLVPKTAPTFQHGRAMVAKDLLSGVGAGSSELHILRPNPGVDARFLAYVARSSTFIAEGVTAYQGVAGLQRVTADFVADWAVSPFNQEEQRRIADFLDHEIGRLDVAERLTEEQVTLLNERRRALTDNLMAQLRIGAPMIRLKYLVRERDERFAARGGDRISLSVSIHRGVIPRDNTSTRQNIGDDLDNYKVCDPGDIVVNRMRAFQGGVGVTRVSGLVSPDYTVLVPGTLAVPDFLETVLRSP